MLFVLCFDDGAASEKRFDQQRVGTRESGFRGLDYGAGGEEGDEETVCAQEGVEVVGSVEVICDLKEDFVWEV